MGNQKMNTTNFPVCKGHEMQLFQTLRQKHLTASQPFVQKKGNGQWAPACIIHTMTWGKWTDQTWEVPARSGNTMAAVVKRWLDDDGQSQGFNYADKVEWPQNSPCSQADRVTIF